MKDMYIIENGIQTMKTIHSLMDNKENLICGKMEDMYIIENGEVFKKDENMENIGITEEWQKYLIKGIQSREGFETTGDVITVLLESYMSKKEAPLVVIPAYSTQGCPEEA